MEYFLRPWEVFSWKKGTKNELSHKSNFSKTKLSKTIDCQRIFWPKHSREMNSFIGICGVQRLHIMNLVSVPLYNRSKNISYCRSRVRHFAQPPFEHLLKNIGKWTLFRQRPEQLLQQLIWNPFRTITQEYLWI